MGWFYLIAAIFFEIGGTLSMKHAQGFTRIGPSISVFLCYGICLAALTLAIEKVNMSVVYAVWAGLGTALIAVIGAVFYDEGFNWLKIASIACIILGVIGLNLKMSH